ncbi:amidohydrolase [Bradyrhizobium sp. AUGA SZCCT0283]|uniref:amidohydrolase family protein n=1 Tax=Bradyrhizobium sp. AUGA SZCCT0283 TaxID=2807671 RepID=UPI001BA5D28E|nr:amidohydrolase family protein [Bradyrhizobium sp. AUGA SZCCT0283]MBR1280072.1 amidohydrolase family protein [Bradyrhizobium sp. AUGA SZCCT0283]
MQRREFMAGVAGLGAANFLAPARAAEEPAAPARQIPSIAGPDPNTRIPAFKAPVGAVDAHCHIFGPAAEYPFSPTRPYTPPDAPLPMFRALHEKIGVERAVIVNATLHGLDNRVVTDAIAKSDGKYRGIANISGAMSDADLAVLDKAGICGCRFAFLKRLGGVGDMGAFKRLVERAAAIGWHVDVYLEPGTIREFAPILKALPTTYVIDHMGTISAAKGLDDPDFKALLDLQTSDEKCWVKITGLERASAAGPPFHDSVPFAKRLIDNAPDRVLWGTDWPHPNVKIMPNDGDLVDLVPLYAPDPAVQRKLLVTNPERLFKFAGAK